MRRTAWPAMLLCAVVLSTACTRTSEGVPTASSAESASATTTSEVPSTTEEVPGVAPTPGPVSGGQDCAPTAPVTAQVRAADPEAPTAVVGVPEGWTTTPTPEGMKLQGPQQMSATVTIAATPLDPAAAFREYADDMTGQAMMSTLSVLPAETCGFSGQKLMGMLGGSTPGSVNYQARIVHVPAAGSNYLIAVYAEAPVDTPGFDDDASILTDGLGVGLP